MGTVKVGQSKPFISEFGDREVVYHSIIIDLSGWVEAKALSVGTSLAIVSFFLENIIYRYGMPGRVVTDGGPEFAGAFSSLMNHYRIEHIKIVAYHPQ